MTENVARKLMNAPAVQTEENLYGLGYRAAVAIDRFVQRRIAEAFAAHGCQCQPATTASASQPRRNRPNRIQRTQGA